MTSIPHILAGSIKMKNKDQYNLCKHLFYLSTQRHMKLGQHDVIRQPLIPVVKLDHQDHSDIFKHSIVPLLPQMSN